MKIRLLPVIISVCVSAVLLFGGYFAYRSVAMESPLHSVVSGIPGAELVSLKLSGDKAEIAVKLAPEASLREVYQRIEAEGAAALKGRELVLKAEESPDAALDQWWASALFEVAQAMETMHYADIPKALEARAEASGSGLTVETEMDEKYVYVTLRNNEAVKRIMLPRTPAKLGVWPNE